MEIKSSIGTMIGRFSDCLGAFLLAIYAFLVVGPLGFLRGPLVLERVFWYFRVLLPMGLLARSVRVAIDWRLGHFDVAIAQAEEVVSHVEDYYSKKAGCSIRKRVLGDLYTILTRSYLHAGHIDEAMQVILRAKKHLGVERLTGLADLDAKTAHLVRAGLAAGKLLEGGGLATMFVKSTPKASQPSSKRQGATREDKSHSSDSTGEDHGAVIIPFPLEDT